MLEKLLAAGLVIYTAIKTPVVIARAARYADTKQFFTRPADEYIAAASKLPLVIVLSGLLTAIVLGGISALAYLFSLI